MNRLIPHDFALKLGIATRIHKDFAVTSFRNGKHVVLLGRKLSSALSFPIDCCAPEKQVADSILKCLMHRERNVSHAVWVIFNMIL